MDTVDQGIFHGHMRVAFAPQPVMAITEITTLTRT